jgi:hypothetical protein
MLGRHKLLLLIPTILLIPILLGLTPVRMAHRLANGCPLAQGKQIQTCNANPFHSLISHNDPIIVNLNLTLLDQELTSIFDIQALGTDSIHSNITFNFVPLRC